MHLAISFSSDDVSLCGFDSSNPPSNVLNILAKRNLFFNITNTLTRPESYRESKGNKITINIINMEGNFTLKIETAVPV